MKGLSWLKVARFDLHGWRTTAKINTVLVGIAGLALIGLTTASCVSSGGLGRNHIFFQGDCTTVERLNTFLHLLINIFATAIVASSNFFMQILNAPTRAEVNDIHKTKGYLEIGVSSMHNLFHRSRGRKLGLWAMFFSSSLPIHLFFNSAVFATDYGGQNYTVAIAAESFLNGGDYQLPGASLATLPGLTTESEAKTLEETIAFMATTAKRWKILDTKTCWGQYAGPSPIRENRDVVVVVDPVILASTVDFHSEGWLVGDLFDNDTSSAINSLWFASACQAWDNGDTYANWCAGPLGARRPAWTVYDGESPKPMTWTGNWDIPLEAYQKIHLFSDKLNFTDRIMPDSTLRPKYCLSRQEAPVCKIGVSSTIMLIVTMCIVAKAMQCVMALWIIQDDPLATPGDGIASFIETPDPVTRFNSAMGGPEYLAKSLGYRLFEEGPCLWKRHRRRIFFRIPYHVWAVSGFLFALTMIWMGVLFISANNQFPLTSTSQAFGESPNNGILPWFPSRNFVSSVLIANIPQLALSLYYYSFNNLITRIAAEKEWINMASDYQALRVTDPKGQQTSTYRLQLPYRYSVPLLAVSTILHWLVGNALYMFIFEGGFYSHRVGTLSTQERGLGLSDDATVQLGFNTAVTLAVMVLAAVIAVVPLALSIPKPKADIVACGANSMIMSAACHIFASPSTEPSASISSDLTVGRQSSAQDTNYDEEGHIRSFAQEPGDHNELAESRHAQLTLADVAKMRLKWGVIRLPTDFYVSVPGDMGGAEHLSFGVAEQGVSPPREGKYYI